MSLMRMVESLQNRLDELTRRQQRTVYKQTALTSTSWDGDSFSTTAKTLIDLSAVFGVPAGVRAVYVMVSVRDSASAGGDYYIILAPNNTAGAGIYFDASGQTNDSWERAAAWIPCDSNGDIYYQIAASGASTLDVYIQVWGFLL